MNAWPRNVLPPERGTRFITGPPMSDSPRPPATVTETSSTLTESRMYVDTPPPLNGAATVMPLIVMRPSLIGPPRAREESHRRRRGERALVDGQAGDGIQQGADGAVRRNGRDDVGAEHGLALGGLDVDDRRLTGDRDRLLEGAHTHVDRNRQRRGAAQLDALPLDDVEAGQRERQRVGAGIQTDDAVLPRAVGHGRAHLFDECGAGRLDGHARQYAARFVPDRACQSPLRKRKGRQQDSRRQNQDGSMLHAWRSSFSPNTAIGRL